MYGQPQQEYYGQYQPPVPPPAVVPQYVLVCPLCQQMQPANANVRDRRGREMTGSRRCVRCGERVAYGPTCGVFVGGGIMLAMAVGMFVVFVLMFKGIGGRGKDFGGAMTMVYLTPLALLGPGACFCCYGGWLHRLPKLRKTVWPPIDGTAPAPSTSVAGGAPMQQPAAYVPMVPMGEKAYGEPDGGAPPSYESAVY